ncbi:MAG TPA: transcription antitermination factor NusB [Myxococcota bacterium]|nr:transcription antitermination factor NusB [Myxococcota bacterium]
MKERRLAREVAMQILFQWEAQGILSRNDEDSALANIDIDHFLKHFLETFYARPEKIDLSLTKELLQGVLASLSRIDALLLESSIKWKLSRMDAIDRAILRLACFELAITKKLSPKIVINEAVEIAKRYGSEQSAAFVNGILDSISSRF